jgi:hypothetical protein
MSHKQQWQCGFAPCEFEGSENEILDHVNKEHLAPKIVLEEFARA